jgi:hypothetical protein
VVVASDIEGALRRGGAEAYKHAPGTPTEPELVAGVFASGIPHLAKALQSSAPGARIAGVFCHSRPMATKSTDSSWKCEVGDLLIVSRYDDGRTIERAALLLQVKKPPLVLSALGRITSLATFSTKRTSHTTTFRQLRS